MTAPDTLAHPAPTPSPAQLLGLIARQRDLYEQLQHLSDQQGRLIAEGETERLLSLLAQRQTLVEQLGNLSLEVSPHRTAIASLANDDAQPLAERVRALVEEVRGLLESIIRQDDAGRRDLEAARDEVGSQVRQAAKAPAALGAYGGAAAGPTHSPRFTDQRG